MDLTKPAEDIKAITALLKIQLNLCSTLIDLPKVIQETRKQIDQKRDQQERIGRAAEAIGIHEVGGQA
jgi:hypothetical protein